MTNTAKGQYDRAAEAGKLEASGAWANDVSGKLGWDNRQKMMNAAAAHPSAPAQDAKFPTIAAQVGDLLYARRDVFEPTLAWMLARAGSPPSSSR
jgi:hypothetical protein